MTLDQGSETALRAKRALKQLPDQEDQAKRTLGDEDTDLRGLKGFDDYKVGAFRGLESIRLRWFSPDYFEFIPRSREPFAFVRSTGEVIEPRRMFTDGGSIPRSLWWKESFSPWGYGPAFLVHDWEFDVHHCKKSEKSFEDVRDTMMEAMKTLIVIGVCPRADTSFKLIYAGINSFVARRLWEKSYPDCPIPPDRSE